MVDEQQIQLPATGSPDRAADDGATDHSGVVYSYPSGHVLEVLTIQGIIAVRGWRSARRLLLRLTLVILVTIEVVLVGIARLALNEHFPTDVLAGLLGGIGALSIYAWLTRPGSWAQEPATDSNEARGAREAG